MSFKIYTVTTDKISVGEYKNSEQFKIELLTLPSQKLASQADKKKIKT